MRPLVCCLILLLAPNCIAQDSAKFPPPVTVNKSMEKNRQPTRIDVGAFGKSVMKAARKAKQKGTITRRQMLRLRVALLSPAFRQHAEDLAVIQMAFSGEDVPEKTAGGIDRTAIDWEGLAEFLERLVPILLALLDALG